MKHPGKIEIIDLFSRQPSKYSPALVFRSFFSSGRFAHQRLPRQNPRAVLDVVTKFKMVRRQHDDGRAVLEPAEFVALAHTGIAGEDVGPRVSALSNISRKCSRMLATRMAATGTSVRLSPEVSRVSITARSFLQNSRSTRFSAIGLTFQVSPLMKVTRSIRKSCGA